MGLFDFVCFDRQTNVSLGPRVVCAAGTSDISCVDLITKAIATLDLIAVDDHNLVNLTVNVVVRTVLVLTEVIKTIVVFGWTNVEKALAVTQEILPD